jgi:hypothetical protein
MAASRLRAVRDLAFVLDRVVAPERLAYEQISGKHPLSQPPTFTKLPVSLCVPSSVQTKMALSPALRTPSIQTTRSEKAV